MWSHTPHVQKVMGWPTLSRLFFFFLVKALSFKSQNPLLRQFPCLHKKPMSEDPLWKPSMMGYKRDESYNLHLWFLLHLWCIYTICFCFTYVVFYQCLGSNQTTEYRLGLNLIKLASSVWFAKSCFYGAIIIVQNSSRYVAQMPHYRAQQSRSLRHFENSGVTV